MGGGGGCNACRVATDSQPQRLRPLVSRLPSITTSSILKIFAIKKNKRVNGDNLQVAKLAFIYKGDCTVQKFENSLTLSD